jgi:hypothetical protein
VQTDNTPSDIFRFMQLVPPRPAGSVPLLFLDELHSLQELTDATTAAGRRTAADRALADPEVTIHAVSDLDLGAVLARAARRLRYRGRRPADLLSLAGINESVVRSRQLADEKTRLANTLMAATYATSPGRRDLNAFADLLRLYEALATGLNVPLDELDRWQLLAERARPTDESTDAAGVASPPASAAGSGSNGGRTPGGATTRLTVLDRVESRLTRYEMTPAETAAAELAALDRGPHIQQPSADGHGSAAATTFTLTPQARATLSAETLQTVQAAAIDLTQTPAHAAVGLLEDAATGSPTHHGVNTRGDVLAPRAFLRSSAAGPTGAGAATPAPASTLQPSGFARLLVVRQQIKRYEAGEIAHVENVMAGERRVRRHRQLDRTEETTIFETETTNEKSTELETADRFELNRETSRTIEQERQAGVDLTLSGRYGPTVEFTSTAELATTQAEQESTRMASEFSKSIVQRSLDRVVERVRTERIRRVLSESEERNLHELKNSTTEHSSGIYQFIDKVYEAQVFDYGIRQMFDFMVPEPASFLWFLDNSPAEVPAFPPAPTPLSAFAPNAGYISPTNYRELAALYRASGVAAPPPIYQTVDALYEFGADNASEAGRPRRRGKLEFSIPAGYLGWHLSVAGLALSDDEPVAVVSIAGKQLVARPGAGERTAFDASDDSKALVYRLQLFADFSTDPVQVADQTKLVGSLVMYESNSFAVHGALVCRRSNELLNTWKLATYTKLEAAYQDRVREHQQTVDALQAAMTPLQQTFGRNPRQARQVIRDELKKHCISILTRQRFDIDPPVMADDDPPTFDFDRAATHGSFVRFFEQAFEWDQLQYVLYPYYWAEKSTWPDRFSRTDVDPEFGDFWRSGSARVVVPARPGFESAIRFFLEHGRLWSGLGNPSPVVTDPLYLPIVDEIRERTGASQGEIPVGEPWDVRLPTPLVLLRATPDLPSWSRTDPNIWAWAPDPPSPSPSPLDEDGHPTEDDD